MPVGSCLAIPGGSKLEATLALSIVAAHEQKGTWMASQWELRKGCPDGACQEVSLFRDCLLGAKGRFSRVACITITQESDSLLMKIITQPGIVCLL